VSEMGVVVVLVGLGRDQLPSSVLGVGCESVSGTYLERESGYVYEWHKFKIRITWRSDGSRGAP
jgi:hypothetical protein